MTNAAAITARLAAGHNGVLSIRQARDASIADHLIEHQLRTGVLEPVHRGVYRHVAAPPSWHASIAAALAASGDGAATSHRTAARLHGLDGVPRSPIELTVPSRDLPMRRGLLIHRTTRLEPSDLCVVSGLHTTTIPRTLLDLGAVLTYEQVEHTAQDAIIRKLTTEGALAAVLERVGGRGRRGTATLRSVLRHAVPDARLATMLEHKLHELIRRAGFPPPELQHELVCSDGRRVFLDAAWPEWRLTIEGDGHRWLGTSKQLRNDLARSRSIQASGWTHYRYGWTDVTEGAAHTLTELCRLVPK